MEKDITTKDLLSNNDVFADIANVNLFDGELVIRPEDLVSIPLETSYKDLDGKHHKLFRDTLMQVNKLGGCIAFIGFENQVDINRAMPVRDMGYTYTGYAKQIKDIVAQNNAEKNSAYTKVLHEDQKLMPVATFILYFGEEKWTKPLSLMDILNIPEEEKDFWSGLINDYQIRVIHMIGQPEEVRAKYCSDYGVVADYLAYYKDKNLLRTKFWPDMRKLSHVEQVIDMLNAFSGDKSFEIVMQKFEECEEKEAVNTMCLLIDMVLEEGMEKGIDQGIGTGMKKQARLIAERLLSVMEIPMVSEMTGLTVEEVEGLAMKLADAR